MLTISNKSRYGLKATMALAESQGSGLMQTKDIAARQDIPLQFLEQIFNQLRKANIIQSVRGKYGGYKLARPANEITASEIIALLEGGIDFSLDPNDSLDVTNDLFRSAEKKIFEVFAVTLADLADRQKQLRNTLTYHI